MVCRLSYTAHAVRADGREYTVRDDAEVLEFFRNNSGKNADEFIRLFLSDKDFWGEDLTEYQGLAETVSRQLSELRADPAAAVAKVLKG